jgi:hypothetical protein
VTPLATEALGSLSQGLRTELLQEFGKITRNYRENRWEAAELNGGRFLRNRLHDPRWIPRWAPVRDRRIQAEGHEELAYATLLLAHSAPGGVSDHQLARDLEQSRLANYRRVLDKLHSARKIEYTKATGLLAISPSGIRDVEKWLLPER